MLPFTLDVGILSTYVNQVIKQIRKKNEIRNITEKH
ncbi:hypothetical protein RUMGNA_03913 [Mediterraneibacter gnavus ATCC 29149]|uniref:Uncharacterized protein n=1 Tax=Mediterraneibacter gnavus (strain ATCC 29149 / DSM 114966 / JCM 6515 / VPI C7-9) TaxID=411470 RepID=A7B8J1_MEDG7|nr:hypothetical protein RUMGNA_03913 [Mediterraneibacter gnavus ATCC 29149]